MGWVQNRAATKWHPSCHGGFFRNAILAKGYALNASFRRQIFSSMCNGDYRLPLVVEVRRFELNCMKTRKCFGYGSERSWSVEAHSECSSAGRQAFRWYPVWVVSDYLY